MCVCGWGGRFRHGGGAVSDTFVQPDGCRNKGVTQNLLDTVHLPPLIIEGMEEVAQDGLDVVLHPPLHHCVQTVLF